MSVVNPNETGVISPTELYTLRAFKRRLGITDATLRMARRRGLTVIYLHRQGYIHGKEWIRYVLNSETLDDGVPTSVTD